MKKKVIRKKPTIKSYLRQIEYNRMVEFHKNEAHRAEAFMKLEREHFELMKLSAQQLETIQLQRKLLAQYREYGTRNPIAAAEDYLGRVELVGRKAYHDLLDDEPTDPTTPAHSLTDPQVPHKNPSGANRGFLSSLFRWLIFWR